jgi:CRISPR system Cascade subunit CasC
MSPVFIDYYVLQTVPPSNLNRDDQGSPKTAYYGGVQRARVSSQAWKRPVRVQFRETATADILGVRTKRVLEVLRDRISARSDAQQEEATELAKAVLGTVGIKLTTPRAPKGEEPGPDEAGYLVFLGNRQFDRLADVAIEARGEDAAATIAARKKDLKAIAKQDDSIDVALFGRMVADDTDLNVDAAAQVAHAISVHEVVPEADYFTAVDDAKESSAEEDSGAAMIGTVEFNSSTLYRYATVNLSHLQKNLGDAEASRIAVEAFTRGFVTTIPSGKQNTFAHGTLPDLVVVSVRTTQPVNLVGAFERPVKTDYVQQATERLVKRAQDIDAAYGTAPTASWVTSVGGETAAALALASSGESSSLDVLVTELGQTVLAQLQA